MALAEEDASFSTGTVVGAFVGKGCCNNSCAKANNLCLLYKVLGVILHYKHRIVSACLLFIV